MSDMLERTALTQTLSSMRDRRAIAICAPAGYGKTTALTQWLEKSSYASAIFALDEYDNNLTDFCRRFCSTLITCQPQNKTLAAIASHESFDKAPEEFTLRAVAALSGRKQTILALDDFHILKNGTVLQLLLTLIKRLPARFLTVISSRQNLPHSFSDLFLKGQLSYVTAEQFLFSDTEIKALYMKHGKEITKEEAGDINKKINGWAIGINAFLLADAPSRTNINVREYLDDFLRENVWMKWNEPTREFMLRTSQLRKLTPGLCEAMAGVTHGKMLLKELVQRNAFISQLDEETFQYHHLFSQFLNRLCEERGGTFLHDLLITEGSYHFARKDFYSAIDCFIRCKSHGGIIKCFNMLENRGIIGFAEKRLFDIISHPEITIVAKKNPHMAYIIAWRDYLTGNIDAVLAFLSDHYSRQKESVENNIVAYENMFLLVMDVRLSILQWLNIFDMMPSVLNPSFTKWVFSMHMPTIHRGLRDFSELALGNVEETVKQHHSRTSLIFGDENAMIVRTIVSEIYHAQGLLRQSHDEGLNAMAEIKSHFFVDSKFCTMACMVNATDALDEALQTEADELLKAISDMIEKTGAFHLLPNFKALKARRAIKSGNAKAAEEWLNDPLREKEEDPTIYGFYANFTTCRAYIATGRYGFAAILLNKVLSLAIAYSRPLDILEAHVLLAVAYWKGRKQKRALDNLEKAIAVARPYHYVQMFVNEGAEVAGMLYKIQKKVEQSKNKKNLEFINVLTMKTRGFNNNTPQSIDKNITFTEKQKTVIDLLCQGVNQREIAESMGIKLSSLRSHIEAVYTKLGVTNLADAIMQLNTLDLED